MAVRFAVIWSLLVAFLSGCDIVRAVILPGEIVVERDPPNQAAEISYVTGSTDFLQIRLGRAYHAVAGVEIQTGDELRLVAVTNPQPTVISKRWIDQETYAFEMPHAGFHGAVRILSASGRIAVEMSRAKVDPRYLSRSGFEVLIINPSSGSATASAVPTSLELL